MNKKVKKLHKFLVYILGKNPYEFGLFPDENNFVKIKELIKAVNEENDFHITIKNIEEIFFMLDNPEIEIENNHIRLKNAEKKFSVSELPAPPKTLYSCVRKKALAHVIENGIKPYSDNKYVILSSEKEMAERIGRRKDNEPALLIINTNQVKEHGIKLYHFGESIYLAEFIPSGTFRPPYIPKEKEDKKPLPVKPKEKNYGSFFIDAEKIFQKEHNTSWKKDKKRKNLRREKLRIKYSGL